MSRLSKFAKHPKQLLQHPKVKQSKGGLNTILKHAAQLIAIESIVCKIVGNTHADHVNNGVKNDVKVASLHQGLLHLNTPSAALATRIKYSQRGIIASLRQNKQALLVTKIRVSVKPLIHKKPNNPRLALPPSVENGKDIATAAQYIEDRPLREALIKLSKRAKTT